MKNPIQPEEIQIYYQDFVDGAFFDGQHYGSISEDALRKYFGKADGWARIIRLLESRYGKIEDEENAGEFSTAHEDYGLLQGKTMTRHYVIDINGLDPVHQEEFRKELMKSRKPKKKNPRYDRAALKEGAKHELEHTSDLKVAEKIATDHLVEDPEYYEKLAEVMENPSGLVRTKKDEAKWKKAKKAVSKTRGYGSREFSDVDWGLVTSIYKSQNPKGETEAQRTFRYWYEQLYLTPAQKKILKRLEQEAQFLFDQELFLESSGASEDEDSLLVQEPEPVFITVHTLSDPSVGIFPLRLLDIRIMPNGQVQILKGQRFNEYINGYEPEETKDLLEFIEKLPQKLRG